MQSTQRLELVREAEALTNDLVVQRFDASFPGWAPNDPVTGAPPNPWRTAALVLLVLLELRPWYGNGPRLVLAPLAIYAALPLLLHGLIGALANRRIEWKGRIIKAT